MPASGSETEHVDIRTQCLRIPRSTVVCLPRWAGIRIQMPCAGAVGPAGAAGTGCVWGGVPGAAPPRAKEQSHVYLGEEPRPVHVAIEVEGIIHPRWSEWFNGQEVRLTPFDGDASRTTSTADLPDQSALPALLASVTGLNLKSFR